MNDQIIYPVSQKRDKDSTLITSIQQHTEGFKKCSMKKRQSKLRAQTRKKEIQRGFYVQITEFYM